MKATLSQGEDGDEVFVDIMKEISRMPVLIEKEEKKVMKKIGGIIADNIAISLPKSDPGGRGDYKGNHPYVHMKEDIKVKTGSKNGVAHVIINGGKKTGYKWHLVNDGTRDSDGQRRTQGIHFIEKALNKSEAQVESLIDELIREVAGGG